MSSTRKHLTGCLLLTIALTCIPLFLVTTQNIQAQDISLPYSRDMPLPDSTLLVVFAGYIGCGDYCPNSLRRLSTLLNSFTEGQVSVAFLNILKGTPDDRSMSYARAIDQRFVGYTIKEEQGESLYRRLGISSGSTTDIISGHATRTYLFQKASDGSWVLAKSHNTLPPTTTYISEIEDLLAES